MPRAFTLCVLLIALAAFAETGSPASAEFALVGVKSRPAAIRNGIDVLESRNFDLLRRPDGQPVRVGLVTNQTGIDSRGRRTIDILAAAPGITLAAIFSPEHGLSGTLDTPEISNSTDAPTGVPVISVYGSTDRRRRPAPESLRDLDVVVYDIQDVSIRFFTYETTLGYFLEAAAHAGKPIFVLDRPNPLTGDHVQGPLSHPELCPSDACRFVNYHRLPLRHGMTIGELARKFNAERHLGARLTVVPLEGWSRRRWFDSLGLNWVNPSPNLRSLTEATLYGGVGLIEGTNVSVGRGTATPFEVVGAPWISTNAAGLAQYLNRRRIAGVRFAATSFTPVSSRYAGQLCAGVKISVLNRQALDVAQLGLELAGALHRLYPGQYRLDAIADLLSDEHLLRELKAGSDPRLLARQWRDELRRFRQLRRQYLLY